MSLIKILIGHNTIMSSLVKNRKRKNNMYLMLEVISLEVIKAWLCDVDM